MWQQGRLALYLLHFHGIGQVVDFNLYQSVVGFQVSFPLFAAGIFCGRADAWQFVYAGVVSVASGDVGNEAAQGGYVSGFVLGFHLLHQGVAGPCAECLFAGFTSGAYKGKFHGVLAVLKSAKLLKMTGQPRKSGIMMKLLIFIPAVRRNPTGFHADNVLLPHLGC